MWVVAEVPYRIGGDLELQTSGSTIPAPPSLARDANAWPAALALCTGGQRSTDQSSGCGPPPWDDVRGCYGPRSFTGTVARRTARVVHGV